jgi:flagellar export protein FliJ
MTTASKRTDQQMSTLLRLRELTRDERRASLAEAHRADEELARQLAQIDAEQQRLRDECRKAAVPGIIAVDRLVEAHRYVVGLQTRESELQEQRESLAAEIDRRRQSLVKADQDVQVIEKLQNRRLRIQRLEEERLQAKQIDEAALQAVMSQSGSRVPTTALRSA